MDKIILLIRRSDSYYLTRKVDLSVRYSKEQVNRNLASWSLFLKMPYTEFRKRLSAISSSTFSQNSFDRIYFWGDYDELKDKEGIIVVPLDEDDWIHPSLADNIRHFDFQGNMVLRWKVINVSFYGRVSIHGGGACRSCGYAVKTPAPRSYIFTNTNISKMNSNVIKLDNILSVKIDNLSSRSFLNTHSFDTIIECVKDRRVIEDLELLGEYKPMVKSYNELLLELYDSCKI